VILVHRTVAHLVILKFSCQALACWVGIDILYIVSNHLHKQIDVLSDVIYVQ